MRFIAALSSLALVAAQSNNVVVQVGSTMDAQGGIFQFIPPTVTAPNGTTITFRFTGAPGNHSITQSTFADPCNPMPGGFDSGNVFIPMNNVSVSPEWNLTVTNDAKPIWFFCKQLFPLPHCSAGMVGAINPPATGNTFANFQNAAKAFKGTSGQGEGGLVGLGASASAFPAPLTDGASLATGGPPVPAATSGANGTSGGASSPAPSPSGNSTSSALAMSGNTFLLFSAAALGVVLA